MKVWKLFSTHIGRKYCLWKVVKFSCPLSMSEMHSNEKVMWKAFEWRKVAFHPLFLHFIIISLTYIFNLCLLFRSIFAWNLLDDFGNKIKTSTLQNPVKSFRVIFSKLYISLVCIFVHRPEFLSFTDFCLFFVLIWKKIIVVIDVKNLYRLMFLSSLSLFLINF